MTDASGQRCGNCKEAEWQSSENELDRLAREGVK